MSCDQGCRTEDCAHQREGDTWLTPRQPVFLPPRDLPASTETGLGADLSDFPAGTVPTHVERLDRDGGEQR